MAFSPDGIKGSGNMKECVSSDCLQEIANFTEHAELLSNAQHECKFHPETKKESCEQFIRLRTDIGKKEGALIRSCDCKKLEKMGV
jgi:hypothetical protein